MVACRWSAAGSQDRIIGSTGSSYRNLINGKCGNYINGGTDSNHSNYNNGNNDCDNYSKYGINGDNDYDNSQQQRFFFLGLWCLHYKT